MSERERFKGRKYFIRERERVYVCVRERIECVCKRERERVCVWVCERKRERNMQDNKKNRDAKQTYLVLYHAIICMSHNAK